MLESLKKPDTEFWYEDELWYVDEVLPETLTKTKKRSASETCSSSCQCERRCPVPVYVFVSIPAFVSDLVPAPAPVTNPGGSLVPVPVTKYL